MANCKNYSNRVAFDDQSCTVFGSDDQVSTSGCVEEVTERVAAASSAQYDATNAPDNVHVEVISGSGSSSITAKGYLSTWFSPPEYNTKSPTQDKEFPELLLDSYFPLLTRRFRYAVCFIFIGTVIWCVYGGLKLSSSVNENAVYFYSVGVFVVFACEVASFAFTFANPFRKYYIIPSLFMGPGITVAMLSAYGFLDGTEYEVSAFAATVFFVVLMYTCIPLPLYVIIIDGVIHCAILEGLSVHKTPEPRIPRMIAGRVLLQLCVHVLGVYLFIILQVRRYSLFQKMHQATLDKHVQEEDKKIKERMIHSLMPPSVASNVIDVQDKDKAVTFRPFNVDKMDEVSILFADIVGFTKMSSNKTAEHLVALLSDLFGRFDKLCEALGCEKISTLGDCYYCVSGCPEKNKDHAKCCVEMGLGMIKAIQEFDRENDEQVNMRVGVHTGTVLCGIVGSKRFKFDVWSNDVTLANIMEASGQPGRVHISHASYVFLEDEYEVEEGEDCLDNRIVHNLIEHYDAANKKYTVRHQENEGKVIKTYFIVGRKNKPVVEEVSEPAVIAVENEERPREDSIETDKLETVTIESKSIDDMDKSNSSVSPNDTHSLTTPAPLFNSGSEKITENFLALKQNQFRSWRYMSDTGYLLRGFIRKFSWRKLHVGVTEADSVDDGLSPEDIIENLQNISARIQKPPMNPCTLRFDDNEMEKKFMKHSLFDMPESFHVKMEIVVSFILFFVISICCFVMLQHPLPWIVLFPLFILVEFAFIFKNILAKRYFPELVSYYAKYAENWVVRSIEGTILAIIPVIAAFSNFSCLDFTERHWQEQCFCYIFIFSLFNLLTFTTVNSAIKSVLAIFACFVVFLFHVLRSCADESLTEYGENGSDIVTVEPPYGFDSIFFEGNRYLFMIDLDFILPLLLILFLNRECEISYRISYHCDAEAISCQEHIKKNRNQIECLLHNIIPEHISSKLNKGRYSKNHQNIGVIFAGLVNFNDLYEESFEGGREMLRVLNELVGDYEELLDQKEYKDVEKIKTITSTFMAASGLDEKKRNENKHPHAHLFNLMKFAIDMQQVIERFNKSMINFEFILNIGFNFGEVTAGVIGTTKLLFDIWGDTVNVSSRMYSNGAARRIQVPSSNIEILSEMFEFEYRGTMQIKGKGEMGTYLLVKQKDGATWS